MTTFHSHFHFRFHSILLQQTGNFIQTTNARNSTSDDHDSPSPSQPIVVPTHSTIWKTPWHSIYLVPLTTLLGLPSHFRFSPTGTPQSPFSSQPRLWTSWTASDDWLRDWLRDWQLLMIFLDLGRLTCEKVAALVVGDAAEHRSLSGAQVPTSSFSSTASSAIVTVTLSRPDGPRIGRADFPPSGFVLSVLCRGWDATSRLGLCGKETVVHAPLSHASGKLGLSLDRGHPKSGTQKT